MQNSLQLTYYITDDPEIKVGDLVVVPYMDNREQSGIVASVGQYIRRAIPVPFRNLEKVIKRFELF